MFRKGLVFGIILLFVGSCLIQNIRGNTIAIESKSTNKNKPQSCDIKIDSHSITQEEVDKIKENIGVRDLTKNYSIIFDGHCTGFAPPSEETYKQLLNSVQIVDMITSYVQPSSSYDLSTDPCFPVVGNQWYQGSCTAWATTYYATGYIEAKLHNWNQAYQGNTNQILSPAWTYNKCNGGTDEGSNDYDNLLISKTIGVCRWSKMPYYWPDYSSWGDENAWRDAPSYRVKTIYSLNSHDIAGIKTVITNGYPLTLVIDADSYNYFGSDDVLGSSAMKTNLNHVNTIVGYDDSKQDTETGEIGAFKIVNSWGSNWGPDNNGYYWITYQAFYGSWNWYSLKFVDLLYNNSNPKLLGIWNLNPQCDRYANVKLGIGDYSEPLDNRYPYWVKDYNHLFPSFMCLDITEFFNNWMNLSTHFYLEIDDSITDGTITSFKLEYYQNGYAPGLPTKVSYGSPNAPKNTPCYVALSFSNLSMITNEWMMFRHDLNHSGYSLSTIPDSNQIVWDYSTGSSVFSSPAILNGIVYVGSYDGKLYCLNSSTGKLLWSYTAGSSIGSSPIIMNGLIYFGSWDNKVYCLNASTGTKLWSYTTGSSVESSPIVINGKVYVGSNDNKFYCLYATTGGKIWDFTTNGSVFSSPAYYQNKIYFGSSDKNIYCLNESTGIKIWNYTTGSIIRSSPSISNGKIYIGSNDNKLYCLNASTGSLFWTYVTNNSIVSSPAIANGKIYVGSLDHKLYCLNALTGSLIWSYNTDYDIWSSPVIADGKVCIGSFDGKVYCLNASVGTMNWFYTTGSFVASSPVVANGKIYIGSFDKKIYCFGPSYYVGYLHIEQTTWYINITSIPNIIVSTNGDWVTFWADYYMDCPGAADDGYVDISFTDSSDSFATHTGGYQVGRLLISHFIIPGQQVRVMLHLKYTDWWGLQTIYEMTKYNYGSTLPDSPSNLNAYNPTLSSIDLSWVKGIGADKTKILRKTNSYPNSTTDGIQVYFDTGNSFNDIGLNQSTTYYYRAWSYYNMIDAYSLDYSQDSETTLYPNRPPNKPDSPSGETNGKINNEYTYITNSIDIDCDQIYYLFDWGDGTNSGWVGPFESGANGSASHKWVKGNYEIKVKAKDVPGLESDWSDPLSVTITRNKAIDNPLLRFFENHPLLFRLLQLLFRQLQM